MELNINLESTVSAALESALNPDRVRDIIETAVKKTVDHAIDQAFRPYGEFGKTVEKAIATLMPHSLDMEGVSGFNDLILKVIAKRVQEVGDERIEQALLPTLNKLLAPAPAELKLSDLVQTMLDEWGDHYRRDGSEKPTIIVERSDSIVSASGYHHIYLDPKDQSSSYGSSKYACRVQIDITGQGDVYSLKVDGKDIKEQLFAGPMYDFDRYVFHLYTGKTKIIVDRTDFDDVYYSGSESDD